VTAEGPSARASGRVVKAFHGLEEVAADPADEIAESDELRRTLEREQILERYAAALWIDGLKGQRARRVILRAICKRFGSGVKIGMGVLVLHPHTFEIGDAVFIGNQTFLQGRHDGRCVIGAHTWIGPQSYFDCRDMEFGEYVGWGPGAKVLGSEHTGEPRDVPIIKTDLVIKRVTVGNGADIGVNAVLLPGVSVGEGAIIGAGAVVPRDTVVPPYAIYAGVPAKLLRYRDPTP
jgi:acetyltransferase-like isoleucine patch superfamily enzyme